MSVENYLYTCLFSVLLSGFVFLSPAQAEKINDYTVDIKINRDSSIEVSESIEYDFEGASRHGIFRTIPKEFGDSVLRRNIEISNVKVVDSEGNERPFTIDDNITNKKIKIGDPDKKVSGIQTYNISYQVDWAFRYFKDYDELYWNAIGGQWQVSIDSAEVTVELPQKIERPELKVECYIGTAGSENNCENIYFSGRNGKVAEINFKEKESLAHSEAFTVAVGLPKGVVKEPTKVQEVLKYIKDNWLLSVIVVMILIMFIVWYKWGRDRPGRGSVIAHYEPPEDLTPVEMGMLVDEKIHRHDLSAQIIYLATKGFLEIEYKKEEGVLFDDKKYVLKKKKEPNKAEHSFDQKLLSILFEEKGETELEDIKPEKAALYKMKKDISRQLTAANYYRYNPKKMRRWFLFISAVLVFGSTFVFHWYPDYYQASLMTFFSGAVIGIFGYFMTPKSKQGAIVEEKVLGFKKYLSVAEEERIEFHNAPEKNPETFEKFLPYAIAFEVEDQWAQEFEDIYNQEPDWYYGYAGGYSATTLADSMGNFDSAIAESSFGQSASSGTTGGVAGGGAGGGGGGSW
ncbi:MAG: DUF2207 domain-containing protein [Candidatus Paceibacteria bacterium]